jgi:hypothetical protein
MNCLHPTHPVLTPWVSSPVVVVCAVMCLMPGSQAQVTYNTQLRYVWANAVAQDPDGIEPIQDLTETVSAPDFGPFAQTVNPTAVSGTANATAWASEDSTALTPTGFAVTGSVSGTALPSSYTSAIAEAAFEVAFTVDSAQPYELSGTIATSDASRVSVQLFEEGGNFLHDFMADGAFQGEGVLMPGQTYYLYAFADGSAGFPYGPNDTFSGSFDLIFVVPESEEDALFTALGLGGWLLWRRRLST